MGAIKTYVFELTKTCTERCSFCYSVSYKLGIKSNAIQMEGEDWIRSLNNIVRMGASAVDFSGGEPTLHPEFAEILRHAKNIGLQTIVSTNGSTIYSLPIVDSIDNFADFVSVSLHGSIAAVHDQVKKMSGSFEYAINSINHYYKNFQLTGLTRVKVNTVAHQENISDLVQIGKTIEIEKRDLIWKISQAIPRENGKENKAQITLSDDAFDKLKNKIIASYPVAYSQGRIVFRDDDTLAEKFSPYLIVGCDGQLHYPSRENHFRIGVQITDAGFLPKIQQALQSQVGSFSEFSELLRENHEESYGTK